jgi:glycosyltransferase involved in cell wall biosynthesis
VIPTKNEHLNIERCLRAIVGWANEIVVVDSASIDNTIQIAKRFGADVIIFNYKGGWPKKRQWALDSYHFRNEWILLLDVDEILDEAIKEEIASRLLSPRFDAYYLRYRIIFRLCAGI